jgi:hypothetical protein
MLDVKPDKQPEIFFFIVTKFACRSEINIWKEMNTANSKNRASESRENDAENETWGSYIDLQRTVYQIK